ASKVSQLIVGRKLREIDAVLQVDFKHALGNVVKELRAIRRRNSFRNIGNQRRSLYFNRMNAVGADGKSAATSGTRHDTRQERKRRNPTHNVAPTTTRDALRSSSFF